MNRKFATKLSILVGALAMAALLTVVRPSPVGLPAFTVGPAEARPAPGAPAVDKKSYDLTKLTVVNNTLVRIRDSYVDPTRIDPKEMLYAALDSVQKNVPEVLAEPKRDTDEILVTVNDKSQSFSVKDVDSPWKLSAKMKAIFRFVQANINPSTDPVQIEYAAVNGMLSTLDPHSMLLDPEAARDMDTSTSGKFGGIGITIGMRKHKKTGKETLTVLNLISNDSPAAKAGLKQGDYIVKINDDPTENLTLNEAMGRLRGDPNSKVTVTVERPGVDGLLVFPITRDVIRVSSVKGRLLKNNVGYLSIDQFAYETSRDLKAKVEELKKQGAKAWILDLRGNPGGLLDQAIRVSDLFLDTGTIVTTVGKAGKEREEKRAQREGTEEAPLVVLVNGGSASASEIVSGALKNLNRAVIIGQTTFGKGSVQVLYDNDDGSKLKLTIAQYLTPGDVSIQGVGITPDIELDPVRVPYQMKSEKDILHLVYRSYIKESDLEAHLTSKNARAGGKPSEVVQYLYEPRPRPGGDDAAGPEELENADAADDFYEDWQIQFARDFVAQATTNKRPDIIAQSKKFVAARRVEEEGRVAAALGKLGLDWSVGKPSTGAPKLSVTFSTDKQNNAVNAGDVVAVTATVKNDGDAAAYQVHATAKTDDWGFDGTELVFGKVDPGQSRSWTTWVKVDKASVSRVDALNWEFAEANGAKVDAAPLKLTVKGSARPQFAYTYQLIDDGGNGDGLVQLGESYRMLVSVKNVGAGKALNTTAWLRNSSGDGVVMNKVRYELGEVASGESRQVEFTFDVRKEFADKQVHIELTVYDNDLHESLVEMLKFPVRAAAAGPEAASGSTKVKTKDAQVFAGEADDAQIIGTAKKGAVFRVRGRDRGWVKVEVEPGRPGFLRARDVSNGGGEATANALTPIWQVTPPVVAVNNPTLETQSDHWQLKGVVKDDNHVEDMFVIVANRDAKIDGRKVFYKSNRGAKDERKMEFDASIPVWPGGNEVVVIVRENDEIKSTETYWVYRNGGATQASVK
jgi:carboxyl-terminal processing protease